LVKKEGGVGRWVIDGWMDGWLNIFRPRGKVILVWINLRGQTFEPSLKRRVGYQQGEIKRLKRRKVSGAV
jgi:hypothetical protein